MDLIRATGFRESHPRLPEQPIFYPVLTEEYSARIARDWNTEDERSGFVGMCCDSRCGQSFCKSTICTSWEARRSANTGFPQIRCRN
jgi:hypothetical protein